jgi:hypothetical protein
MTTKQLEQGNQIIERILAIQRQVDYQETELKCMREQSEEDEMIIVTIETSGHPIPFKVPIDEMIQLAELSIVNNKSLIGKLKEDLEKL